MQIQSQEDQTDESLPPEVAELLEEMREAKLAKIESIGKFVAKKRDEAVTGRRNSGIEVVWQEDEEYYEGLDEASADGRTGSWSKSPSTTGGLSRTPNKSNTRCTSFFNIIRQTVDSASARMGDILLPAGDWNFSIGPTPVQDAAQEIAHLVPEMMGPETMSQMEATAKAEKAQDKIRDWLTEGSYHAEVRKVIEDASKVGTGVLKGPFPEKRKMVKSKGEEGKTSLEIVFETAPVSRRVDYWDFFPDPTCGEDIHEGSYVLERDRLSAKGLKKLKGVPGYLADQIDQVIDEGPYKRNYTDDHQRAARTQLQISDEKFEVWYYYGDIDVSALSAMNVSINERDQGKRTLPAIVTLVNDTPIKAHINPLDTGCFPYDVMTWQRMSGTWTGIGVARQGRTAQDMINSAYRALMDNAGLSSGPMLIIRKGAIVPADGHWNLTARKVWLATEQADVRSVADAIQAINIPMVQPELMAIIQQAEKMLEMSTGMFMLMQGQQGSAPDTVGGMELLHRNASAPLRRQARVFDERITEPHIKRYYEYLLLHGPEDCKGDYKIEAIGSTALVERDIQSMESVMLLQLSPNPAFGLDPEKAMTEVLKSKRFIPEKWMLDDTQKQERQNQQPSIPAIEVAKIRAAVDEKRLAQDAQIAQADMQRDQQKQQVDMDRDTVYANEMAQRNKDNVAIRMQELQIKRELSLLDYANKRNITLDQVKADLAKEAMRLRTQKELARAAGTMARNTPQVARTTMEPVGKANPGEAFQA